MKTATSFILLTLTFLLIPLNSAAQTNPVSPTVVSSEDDSVRVIVRLDLDRPYTPETGEMAGKAATQRAEIASLTNSLKRKVEDSGGSVYRTYTTVPYVAVKVSQAEFDRLINQDEVADVMKDELSDPQGAADISVETNVQPVRNAGYDGSGQTVVILDTGIDAAHAEFGGRVVDEACFSNGGNGTNTSLCSDSTATSQTGAGSSDATVDQCYDANGYNMCYHGTHVAGIAAGETTGIAPAADIISIQVFTRFECTNGPCLKSWSSDQIAALDYVNTTLRGQYNIAAVNMSLGGGYASSTCDTDARAASIDNLTGNGIPVTISAGNNGYETATTKPGCVSSATTVGAVDHYDEVVWFSNMDDHVDIVAPGASINSAMPGGGYAGLNGTSMAAPAVAGAYALRKQMIAEGHTSTDLRGDIVNTGTLIDDNRPDGVTTDISLLDFSRWMTPNLTLEFTHDAGSYVSDGDSVTFTVEAQNRTFVDGSSVSANVDLPVSTTLLSSDGTDLSWDFGPLPSGGSAVGSFTVQVNGTKAGAEIKGSGNATAPEIGGTAEVKTEVTILPTISSCGFTDGFENGFGTKWVIETTDRGDVYTTGRTDTRGYYDVYPKSGSYQAILERQWEENGSGATASITTTLDLAGETNVDLNLWYVAGLNSETPTGVYISDDNGANWTQVAQMLYHGTKHKEMVLDLDSLANANGLTLTSTFKVRIFTNAEDEFGVDEGIALDDVSVSCVTLPVEFVDLDAQMVGDSIDVTWKVKNEEAVSEYAVEVRGDDDVFDTVATVQANGSGSYTARILNTISASGAFRIQQIGDETAEAYSPTIELSVTTGTGIEDQPEMVQFNAYPTPINQGETVTIQFSGSGSETTVRVYDMLGRSVQTVFAGHAIGTVRETLLTNDLAAGVYIVRLSDETRVETRRITVLR